jgi:hypothetical protein
MTESDSDITFDDEDSSLFEDSDYVGGSESEGGVGFLLRRKEGSTQVPPSPNDMQSSACESSPALTSAYSSSPGYMYDRRGYNNEYFDGKQVKIFFSVVLPRLFNLHSTIHTHSCFHFLFSCPT